MHKSFNCIHQLAPMCKPCGYLGECASALTPNGISISLAAFTELIRVPNIEINIHTDLRTLHISKHQDCQTFLFVRPYRQFLERSWARLATSQLMKHRLKFKKNNFYYGISRPGCLTSSCSILCAVLLTHAISALNVKNA